MSWPEEIKKSIRIISMVTNQIFRTILDCLIAMDKDKISIMLEELVEVSHNLMTMCPILTKDLTN